MIARRNSNGDIVIPTLIPLSLMGVIIANVVAVVWFSATLDHEVSTQAEKILEVKERVERAEDQMQRVYERAARIDEQVNGIYRSIDRIEKSLGSTPDL